MPPIQMQTVHNLYISYLLIYQLLFTVLFLEMDRWLLTLRVKEM